jgi:lipoic acid synthetase
VITLGRRGDRRHVLLDEGELSRRGVELVETGRGGDVTYHGPGQLVGYPILGLSDERRDAHRYLRDLEAALILTARSYGVPAERAAGLTGVWVGDAKLAAIGVRLGTGWITSHGFALNVGADLGGFSLVVPCGIRDRGVTSLGRLLGREPELREVAARTAFHLAGVLGRRPVSPAASAERLEVPTTMGRRARPAAGASRPERRPAWLKVRLRTDESYRRLRSMVSELKLNTVCTEARCPNIYECWNAGTVTFMILGDTCTRRCGFCNVHSGRPAPGTDSLEPERVAEAVARLELHHAVITSVDRDDLPDGGALHFHRVVRAVHRRMPGCAVEVLTPDFRNKAGALDVVLDAGPEVFAHNVETVPRLYRTVRPGSRYRGSLALLQAAARRRDREAAALRVKSSLMLGLGERDDEVLDVLGDLRRSGVDVVTLGQYLQPTSEHLPVERFVSPAAFAEMREAALALGFLHVESGPLVRSSYHAERHRPEAARAPALPVVGSRG